MFFKIELLLNVKDFPRFSKKFRKFFQPFSFRSTKLIFWALSKHSEDPVLAKFSAQQDKFWKKEAKIAIFLHFLENFDLQNLKISPLPPLNPHLNFHILKFYFRKIQK